MISVKIVQSRGHCNAW